MAKRLVPCSSCARHVRITEAFCPFCLGEAPASLAEAQPPEPPPPGLSRAALYAYRRTGAAKAIAGAAMLAVAACDTPSAVAAYGGVAPPDSSVVQQPTADAWSDPDAANQVEIYGAPPHTNAPPTTAPQAAAYGAPPPMPSATPPPKR